MTTCSIIVPVYRNEESLLEVLDVLDSLNASLDGSVEVVMVVDGSPDNSYTILKEALPTRSFQSELVLLAKNFGSFSAIRTGLAVARGPYFAVMAADLQEPPGLIRDFFESLQNEGVSVVLGVRKNRKDPLLSRWASGIFWWSYRRFIQSEAPRGGVDVFACDTKVRDVLLSLNEANSTLIGLLLWTGFRRKTVFYDRQARAHGKSAWTLRKRMRYMLDSAYAFSDIPILLLLITGIVGTFGSIAASIVVFVAWFRGDIEVQGYTPIMLAIFFTSSLILMAIGVIGGYVWRAFENTKGRPLYVPMEHESFRGGNRA